MATLFDVDRRGRIDLGAGVVAAVRRLREGGVDVPFREARREPANGVTSLARLAHERRVELGLAFGVLLFGVHDAILEVIELGVRVALTAGDGLLATERARYFRGVRFGDFDVPAEDTRVANLQRGDVDRFAELRLEGEDHLRTLFLEPPRLVEPRVVPLAKDASFARERGRPVDERS
jgi:hypothetical protein